jgi:hypothetical protein
VVLHCAERTHQPLGGALDVAGGVDDGAVVVGAVVGVAVPVDPLPAVALHCELPSAVAHISLAPDA